MKSYNHLWEKFISQENIEKAIQNSSKGKRNRPEVKEIFEHPEEHIERIKMYAENFHNKPHKPVWIYDGISRKKRQIIVPSYQEQIIHHMIVNVLQPIFQKGFYEHSYGSIPNKGGHKGKKYIEKWIRWDAKNCKYIGKLDIKQYFNSIPHDILKSKLKSIIHDEKFLELLFEIVDVTDVGIPLGFYTSQWIANWYLTGLDHYIKEDLKVKHYIRYMDDMVIFGSNKRELHKAMNKIEEYLSNVLGLKVKENWQIYRFDYIRKSKHYGRDIDFMGFRFFRDRTLLRKSVLYKATRKARKISKKEKPTIYDLRQMLSYLGWLDATDTYGIYEQMIKPIFDIGKAKKRISKYDKRKGSESNVEKNSKLERCKAS